MIANMNVITPKDNNRLSKMSLIIVIVKIVRIVIRNVVTEIHDCYLLLVVAAGIITFSKFFLPIYQKYNSCLR